MKKLFYFIIVGVVLACEQMPEPHKSASEGERLNLPVSIVGDVRLSTQELSGGRTNALDPAYFFIAVFEEATDSTFASNPHTNQYLYAAGGFRSIPGDLSLSLFSNKTYVIQTLALKKSNGFGIALSDYEYSGRIYDRLDLGWEGNTPLPALLIDSMDYSPDWLNTNSGFALFFDGYMYDDEDSSSLSYFGPLMANAYYQSTTINTNEIGEIELSPERNVFGVEVLVDGLSDSSYVTVKLGRTQTSPIIITEENNGKQFVFLPEQFGSFQAEFPVFKVASVTINKDGEHISNTVFQQEYFVFPMLKKTFLEIILSPTDNTSKSPSINLIDYEMTPGDTIRLGG